MSSRAVSLAIIGGGPAGLSAAAEASKHGIETVVLDLHAQAGGHYFNLPPEDLYPLLPVKELDEGRTLIHDAKLAGSEILTGAEVWGIYPDDPFRICLSGKGLNEIRARKIILAPGAIEQARPFPGWTLPGVITAGGALSLLKNQGMAPGRRVLISGTGPLQMALAAQLAEHDVEVIGLLELKSKKALLRSLSSFGAVFSQSKRIREGMNYLRKIQSKKIPYLFGWSIVRALGEGEVSEAIIAQVDDNGKPIPGTEKSIALDCICTGFGLITDTQFTRLLECAHTLHPQLPAWIPVRDEWLQTTLSGVFAIGDAADISGKTAAVLEGKIAAVGIAHQLGHIDEFAARQISKPLKKKLLGERRFGQILNQIFMPTKDPAVLAEPQTVICRCECITYKQILEAIKDSANSVQAVKYHSRAGMGWCRGTTCAPIISQIIALQAGVSLEHASRATIRPPLFPVPLEEALAHEGLN